MWQCNRCGAGMPSECGCLNPNKTTAKQKKLMKKYDAAKSANKIRRRTLWAFDNLWNAAKKASKAEDRTLSNWIRVSLESKLKQGGYLPEATK